MVESNRPTILISCSPTIEIRLVFPRSTTPFISGHFALAHCLGLIQPPQSSSFGFVLPSRSASVLDIGSVPVLPTSNPDLSEPQSVGVSNSMTLNLHHIKTAFSMGKGRKIDPFHHETRRQKKKREKDAPRDLASQQTLTSLVDGTYQPPRIGNHPRASTSSLRPDSSGGDVGNMDQHPDHYGPDHDDGDYDHMLDSQSHLAHHGSLAATSALSAWGSIPWDVPSSIPNHPSPEFNFLDPKITAAVRNRDRNVTHQRKDDIWQKLMRKLFPVYMWLKVKTQNWTATNALDSFSTKFCKTDLMVCPKIVGSDK
ncbi:hypothetical protein MJO29_003228 [Puccinia striiformis f. sp. tritici]|nr:hypothetical protein MJO29_003228 [Puccinia striiformis f. sp. tritici]